jgi:hypothetical protein
MSSNFEDRDDTRHGLVQSTRLYCDVGEPDGSTENDAGGYERICRPFSLKQVIAELDSISRQIDALTSRVERAVERLATSG